MKFADPDEQTQYTHKINRSDYAMTIRGVAKALGISKSRVTQIEQAAMKKLRKRLIKVGITKRLLL